MHSPAKRQSAIGTKLGTKQRFIAAPKPVFQFGFF
jgi:hypothetical protein